MNMFTSTIVAFRTQKLGQLSWVASRGADSADTMESPADRLARIRNHNIFKDLIVSPRFHPDNLGSYNTAANVFRSANLDPTLRRRRFGRFKVTAHLVSAFAVDHDDDKLKLLGDLFAAGLTGIDRIVLVGTGNLFRLALWIVVFATLFFVTLYFISLSVMEYFKYKTIVSVSLLTGEVRVLPAITICNLNPFKNNVLCNPADALYAERKEMCLAESSESFAFAMSKYKNKAAGNATLQKALDAAVYTWSDMTVSCRYRRENCKAAWINDVIVSIYRYGKCFCIFCDLSKVDYSIDFATVNNPWEGLEMALRSDPTNHIAASENQGFLLMVHDRYRLPDPNSDGLYVPVGMTTFVGVSMKQVNLLPEPFESNCHTSWPEGESYNVFLEDDDLYSEQSCRKMCLNYNIMKDCTCLDLYKGTDFQQLLDSGTICVDGHSGLNCRIRWVQDPENMTSMCNCPKRCDEVQYVVTLSQLAWNTRPNETNSESKSVSHVMVFADSFSVNNIVESQETSPTSALSTVGGFMNMFTGASFLLIYEAFSTLMIWLYKVVTMKPPVTLDY